MASKKVRQCRREILTRVHPETSSPLEGEGWGEGNKKGGGEKVDFRMKTNSKES